MKKSVKFLFPFLLINSASLSSCNVDPNLNKTLLTYGDLHISETNFKDLDQEYKYHLSYDQLKTKMNTKNENFMVSIAAEGCGCWEILSNCVFPYMEKTNSICYRIKLSDFKGKDHLGFELISGDSTFAIIKNGVIVKQISSLINEKQTRDANSFLNFMNLNVLPPKMIRINENDYLNKVLDTPFTKAAIYLSRSECGDCKALEPNILKPYFESRIYSNKLYVLDCQPFYKSSSDSNYQDYLNKKDEFMMTSDYNPDFGYNAGVFPSLFYFEEVTCKAGAIAYNETIQKIDNKYVVTDTYYTDERVAKLEYLNNYNGEKVLLNKEINESQLNISGNYIEWSKEYSNEFYRPIIYSFLDYVLPLENNLIEQ